ncbi:MAG: futalosine hydrolase [Chitinophagaceae bacterium]|nr:MAG: futalosine hydrolase [Chitinophagaceae bacterium]
MQILVISATALEIAPFLTGKPTVEHLITGVGAAACVYHLQKKLQTAPFDLVIQAGVAGSFANGPALGETVLVHKEVFADMGVFEKGNFNSVFDLTLADMNEFPYTQGWLVNDHPLLGEYHLPAVKGVSVNGLSDDANTTALFGKKYGAEVESMEGAAFHYTCLQEKIPFLQLRTVSNVVGERDKSKWNMKEAIENLNNELHALIAHFQ